MTKTWLTIFFVILIWSGINPKDYFTWILEVMPALIALLLLIITKRRFKFTGLAYTLILVHCIILMIGGHYTYAEVPLFNWLKDVLDLERNNYDKVGHFAQGFIPAIVAREILIRNNVVENKYWLITFVITICFSITALYELIEWWVSELIGESAEAFLGTQGYMWDTQSDMGFALLGALLSLVLLSHYHDRQLESIKT
jgi:putative membrane protein